MANVNPQFNRLRREYIFPVIEQKLAELKTRFPDAIPLNLGIGDIAFPLAPSIAKALIDATDEMTQKLFGYGPHNGYLFLRNTIAEADFKHLGIGPDEIFISDGANTDTVNILELFSKTSTVAITDPTYPAYFDASVLAGKRRIIFCPCLEENHFTPLPPQEHSDLIYLCSPNNPTGVAMTRKELQVWVDYALKEKAIILFDHAYEAFVRSPDVPRSIFEIPGAKECAIEFHSFSKKAGFTGLRCAYTVLPKTVQAFLGKKKISLHPLWDRRQSAKFNGLAYPIQKAAEAVYSPAGKKETQEQVDSYLTQAKRLREGLKNMGHTCYGGVDSPYLWWKTPAGLGSWEFFDRLLNQCHLISIPGRGFGTSGEGFVRLSAFTTEDKVSLTLNRIQQL